MRRAPVLGQGANQALQDAYVLAIGLASVNGKSSSMPSNLLNMLRSYERIRKSPTAQLSLKSGVLGTIETLGGPLGTFARDSLFRVLGMTGIAEYIFVDSALPKLQ